MRYSVFSSDIVVIHDTVEDFTVFFTKLNISKTIDLNRLTENQATLLTKVERGRNQILLSMCDDHYEYYMYLYNDLIFLAKEPVAYELKEYYQNSFNFDVQNKYKDIGIVQLGLCTLAVKLGDRIQASISTEFFERVFLKREVCDWEGESLEDEVLSIVNLGEDYLFLIYDRDRKVVTLKKVYVSFLKQDGKIAMKMLDNKMLQLEIENKEKKINLAKLKKGQPQKIFGKKEFDLFKGKNILAILILNRTRFYVFVRSREVYIQRADFVSVTNFKQNLKAISIGKNIYLYGEMLRHAYKCFWEFDYLHASGLDQPIAKFKRPFKNVRFLRRFGYFKMDTRKMDIGNRVHYPLFLGSEHMKLHRFKMYPDNAPSHVYSINKSNPNLVVFRTGIDGHVAYSIIPNNPMYSISNLIKQKVALLVSKCFYRRRKSNVNLYFEKTASKADESGFRVFQRVMETRDWQSKNLYILDKSSKMYQSMKQKYGKHIIARFSFRHYLAIYNADHFISSDLSNHVIDVRIYINSISKRVKEVPLLFLQHGIMFAKPVENPMARGFYKDITVFNIYKSVVSSKLEAQEFYKMGYDESDLLYSGLATLDFAKLDKTFDKIVYMPTYRYWEEGMMYSGDIEKTTYYQTLLKIIQAFEKKNLLDKLLVVSHNKFAEYINGSLPQYQQNFAENPTEALKVGRIFISDYSSAIYDAIYRGAYPIFYWEDKDYLINNYKASPPVNEMNAPGPQAKSIDELMEYIHKAISNEYELEDEYKFKYKQINQFYDNGNTQRIVDFMKDDQIL